MAGKQGLANEAERQSTPAVTRTIDGIKCVAVPVRDNTGTIVGKDWVSGPRDHGAVRDGLVSPQTGAVVGLVVEELAEIHIGAAPDPGAFTIPEVPVEEAIIAEWVWEPIEAQGMCWERSLTPASLGSRRYT